MTRLFFFLITGDKFLKSTLSSTITKKFQRKPMLMILSNVTIYIYQFERGPNKVGF